MGGPEAERTETYPLSRIRGVGNMKWSGKCVGWMRGMPTRVKEAAFWGVGGGRARGWQFNERHPGRGVSLST